MGTKQKNNSLVNSTTKVLRTLLPKVGQDGITNLFHQSYENRVGELRNAYNLNLLSDIHEEYERNFHYLNREEEYKQKEIIKFVNTYIQSVTKDPQININLKLQYDEAFDLVSSLMPPKSITGFLNDNVEELKRYILIRGGILTIVKKTFDLALFSKFDTLYYPWIKEATFNSYIKYRTKSPLISRNYIVSKNGKKMFIYAPNFPVALENIYLGLLDKQNITKYSQFDILGDIIWDSMESQFNNIIEIYNFTHSLNYLPDNEVAELFDSFFVS